MQYYNAPGKQHDTPPHSFNMAEGRRRKFTAAEAVELIWADEDSGNENFDCGSDVESLPNCDDDSGSEESGLDDSIALSNNQSGESNSEDSTGIFQVCETQIQFRFLYLMSLYSYLIFVNFVIVIIY